jgi:hypothetical protein
MFTASLSEHVRSFVLTTAPRSRFAQYPSALFAVFEVWRFEPQSRENRFAKPRKFLLGFSICS